MTEIDKLAKFVWCADGADIIIPWNNTLEIEQIMRELIESKCYDLLFSQSNRKFVQKL